jgi:hypothetical protein
VAKGIGLRTCKDCGSTEDAVRWLVKYGKPVGLRCLACTMLIQQRILATPKGRKKANKASRESNRKARATPEGREKRNEASRRVSSKLRATSEGREKANEAVRKYYATPKGGALQNEAALRWARDNPDKANARNTRRRTAKLKRSPPWLNQAHHAELDGMYHFAKIMRRITEEAYDVDHIVPLQGNTVSGLHVPWNLQVITASENARKGNKHA